MWADLELELELGLEEAEWEEADRRRVEREVGPQFAESSSMQRRGARRRGGQRGGELCCGGAKRGEWLRVGESRRTGHRRIADRGGVGHTWQRRWSGEAGRNLRRSPASPPPYGQKPPRTNVCGPIWPSACASLGSRAVLLVLPAHHPRPAGLACDDEAKTTGNFQIRQRSTTGEQGVRCIRRARKNNQSSRGHTICPQSALLVLSAQT